MQLDNSSKFVVGIIAIISAWYLLDRNSLQTFMNDIRSTISNLVSIKSNPVNKIATESFNNYFRSIENMEDNTSETSETQVAGSSTPEPTKQEVSVSVPVENVSFQPRDVSSDLFNAEDNYGASNVNGETVKPATITKEYNSQDYLPQEVNNKWFNTDFSQAKQNIKDQELIDTRKFSFGVNTVGQSLKNPTYDLRGTIPNPKFQVSAWNNSSIEADYNIRSWCEG